MRMEKNNMRLRTSLTSDTKANEDRRRLILDLAKTYETRSQAALALIQAACLVMGEPGSDETIGSGEAHEGVRVHFVKVAISFLLENSGLI